MGRIWWKSPTIFVLLVAFHLELVWIGQAIADESVLPQGDTSPELRLEANGPRSYVSGVAFSPDGKHLYATGWDKAVQVWNLRDDLKYEYSSGATLRIPTGAGQFGELNALALSSDGKWLAVAGQGPARDLAGVRNLGWILPAGTMSQISQLDNGTIYVFNTNTRTTTLLRGHRGPVQALTFVENGQTEPPSLVSVAEDHTDASTDLVCHVRYWDIQMAKEIADLSKVPTIDGQKWERLPGLKGFRPGLTAWSTGAKAIQARVALAWGDDQLRVWDVQTGQVANVKSKPNLLSVLPISVLPTSAETYQLLTGAHTEIGLWSIPKGDKGKLAAINSQHFQLAQIDSVNGRERNLPNACALIPSNSGKPSYKPTYAAFVVTQYLPNGAGAEYRLVIATAKSPIKTVREIKLPWRGEVRQPAIAVSQDGLRIALAGNELNEIEVYLVEDLLNGRQTPRQVLGSVGLAFKDATFVRSGESWGLQLTSTKRDPDGRFPANSLVFDINKRQIELTSDKWKLATSTIKGWSAESSAPGKLSFRRPEKSGLNLKLNDDHVATGYAFCPPSPHCPIPLIAVASQVRGQPLLQLFSGENGEPLRSYAGHTERILSVAFSEDGRMLVSVGEDRTVCIWTTTDLVERCLGKRGQLPGITVHKSDQRLLVTTAPAGMALQQGDEIVAGLRNNKEVVAIDSAKEFYGHVLDRRPGDVVEFSIRRSGKIQTVSCDVGQAIDEAKPLFTLFVVPDEKNQSWEWIGWNPLGMFDSHGDRIEQWLGWHFNTGEPERPAKFAAIGEYRESFYRRDLLRTLVETQKPPPAAVVEENPKVSVWLRHLDGLPVGTDYDNVAQLEAKSVEMVAEVSGLLDKQILGIAGSIGDAEPFTLTRGEGTREWTANLSDFNWRRGIHRMVVQLKTPNREVSVFERVQFHPAAPRIECASDPDWQREIATAEIMVNAIMTPSSEPIHAELRLQKPGQEESIVLRSWETRESLKIAEKVAIEPGENRLEIVTWNSTAQADDRDLETAHFRTFIRRSNALMAPRLVVHEVSALPDHGEPKTLTMDGDTYQTNWPQVRIRGEIAGNAVLEKATLSHGAIQRDLAGFQGRVARVFKFEEALTLKPGRQSAVVQSSADNELDEKRFIFFYEPPVPQIASIVANARAIRDLPKGIDPDPLVYFERYHEPAATISAHLQDSLDQPYRVTIRVNDVLVPEGAVKCDRSREALHAIAAKIPLVGGKNRVELRVDNEWTRRPSLQTVELDYRRPPEIIEIEAETRIRERPLEITCRIRSAIPLRSTKITIDNADEVTGSVSLEKETAGEYLLRADKIGLTQGEHDLKITATNDEGTSLKPGIHHVVVEKPTAQPPILSITGPTGADTELVVTSRRLMIQYTVRSTVPVSIQLRNRGVETTIVADAVPIDGTRGTIPLDLFEGQNDIEIKAQSSGGFSAKQSLKISYVPQAATVEITSVDDQRPILRNDGTGQIERSASTPRVQLRGRIKTNDRIEPGRAMKARIWVNRFKLPTVDVVVDRNDTTVGTFASELRLSRAKENEIKVEVYGEEGRVASEWGCTNTLKIDCDNPERRQDLYLVLLGTGNSDGLRDRAQAALQAKVKTRSEGSQEMWESDAFSQIHVFDALNVHPATAQHRLLNLVRTMNGNLKSASKSGSQAIVMIYFQGQIILKNDDFSFVTSDMQGPTDKAVTGRVLETNLMSSYGAHLLFLDLIQNTDNLTASDIWPKAPHLGIVVANWKGQGQQPNETRLISALEQSLPQVRVVRDLSSKIEQRYQLARRKFPEQIETVDRLQDLQDLRIGVLE